MRQRAYSRSPRETILLISSYRLPSSSPPPTAHRPQSSPSSTAKRYSSEAKRAILRNATASILPFAPRNDTPHLQLPTTIFQPTAHCPQSSAHRPQSSPSSTAKRYSSEAKRAILRNATASILPFAPRNDTPHLQLPATDYHLPAHRPPLTAHNLQPNAIISGKRQHTSFGFSSQNTIFCAIALRHLLGPFALRIGCYELPVFQYDFGDIVQAVNTVNNKYIIANTPL